jgi:hypothetical protein
VIALTVAVGAALVVAGVAFHGTAAYFRPTGPHPLSGEEAWAFLRWGPLRAAAWAAVAGGTWLLARVWTARRDGSHAGGDPRV